MDSPTLISPLFNPSSLMLSEWSFKKHRSRHHTPLFKSLSWSLFAPEQYPKQWKAFWIWSLLNSSTISLHHRPLNSRHIKPECPVMQALRQKENNKRENTTGTFSFHLLPLNNLIEPEAEATGQESPGKTLHGDQFPGHRAGPRKWMWPGRGSQMENDQHIELPVNLSPGAAIKQKFYPAKCRSYPPRSWSFLTEFNVWIPTSQVLIQIILCYLKFSFLHMDSTIILLSMVSKYL